MHNKAKETFKVVHVGEVSMKVAIPDSQNFHQKPQALAVIEIKISLHQKRFSVSSVERSPLVVAITVDAEVTCVFNFSHTNFN